MTLQERKMNALRELSECLEGERVARQVQYDGTSERTIGCVLVSTVRFTDGTVNVTEWSSGHERMCHEHSIRRMYGNRVTSIERSAKRVGKLKIDFDTPMEPRLGNGATDNTSNPALDAFIAEQQAQRTQERLDALHQEQVKAIKRFHEIQALEALIPIMVNAE